MSFAGPDPSGTDRRRQLVARRRRVLVVLALAALVGLRAGVALGGRWWLAEAATGSLLAGYLLALALAGARAQRRHQRGRQPLPEAPGVAITAKEAAEPTPTIAASVPAEALPPPGPAAERRSRRLLSRRLRPAPK